MVVPAADAVIEKGLGASVRDRLRRARSNIIEAKLDPRGWIKGAAADIAAELAEPRQTAQKKIRRPVVSDCLRRSRTISQLAVPQPVSPFLRR
jgi:hypothetical protein